MPARPTRYSAIAIALHWAIALCIIAMIPMGFWMTSAIGEPGTQALAYRVFQFHKSTGFLILGLTMLRIVWRLAHPAPPLPGGMKPWEAFAARATHAAFYGLMLALPLTGWLYVSTGWAVSADRALAVPTSWFGLFSIPHLPWIGEASAALRRTVAFQAMGAHSMLAWAAVALIALHVGAALKHQFLDRDGVLAHMVPGLPHGDAPGAPTPDAREKWLGRCAGFGLVLIIAQAAAIAVTPAPAPQLTPPLPARPAQTATQTATPRQPASNNLAAAWAIDHGASRIGFTGAHSGDAFSGRFEQWEGDIRFDPANLAGSRATVLVQVGSARTGDSTQENALEGEEWLDPKGRPVARFQANAFRSLGDDRYEATGTLALKQTSLPVVLPFTFSERDGVATVKGSLKLDRRAFDIGMQSDGGGDWVSMEIGVVIDVTAKRAPSRS